MLSGLNHLTLAVSHLPRSFGFYVDVLGFKPRAKWAKGAYLSLGDLWLCLSLESVVERKTDYTHYAFTIASDDMPSLREKIQQAGAIEWKSNKSEGESIYFLDPDGHQLEVHCGDLESRLRSCKENPYDEMEFF